MNGQDSAQERTEQPTPRRRERAREEGRVARTPELGAAVVTLAGAALLAGSGFAAGRLAGGQLAVAGTLLADVERSGPGELVGAARRAGLEMLAVLAPLLAGTVAAAIAAGLVQTRGVFAPRALQPRWSNVDPLAGLRRLFGAEGVVGLLRALLKLVVLGALAFLIMRAAMPELAGLAGGGPAAIVATFRTHAARLAQVAGVAFLVFAAADWAWRRFQLERSLRMTRQEVVLEHRETEGDPLVKARQQSLARARARQRMLHDVRHADVVVANPTHVAVALRYDIDRAPAPVVVAMGQRKLAQRIKEIARRHDVPVLENPPVARALLATGQVGRPIPPALYGAIAEILAFVYRQRGRLPGGGRLRTGEVGA